MKNLILFISLLFTISTSAQSSISMETSNTTIDGQQETQIVIDVKVGDPDAVSNFIGASFNLEWNNTTYVGGVSTTTGTFLGSNPLIIAQNYDNRIEVGVTSTTGGKDGTGTIASCTLKVKQTVSSDVTIAFNLTNINALDGDGGSITLTPTNNPLNILLTGPQPILTVTPDNQDVSEDAGTTSFNVSNTGSGTMDYNASVTTGNDWLEITSGGSGTDNGTIEVTYSENTSSSERSGTITVTANGATGSPKDVTVTQAAGLAVLTVTPPIQSVTYASGSTTFDVTSNVTWEVSVDADWLTVSPASGNNNGTITATYTENTTTSQRVGTITVTGGGITRTVTVTQAAGLAVLTVTPLNQSVSYESGSTTFTVTSNVTWTVSDDAAWLTVSPASGNNNGTITATYTENTTISQRVGTITVTGGGITRTVTVTQAAGSAVLTVTPSNRSVSSDSGSTTFTITSNVAWTVSVDADWLTVSPESGNNDGTITATYTENTTTSQRIGTITVESGEIARTVTVTHAPTGGIFDNNITPVKYILYQNYPNPFNPTTTIDYSIIKAGNVQIKIFDSLGREILSLIDKFHYPGTYSVKITNGDLPSGTYYYTIITENFKETKKMVIVK